MIVQVQDGERAQERTLLEQFDDHRPACRVFSATSEPSDAHQKMETCSIFLGWAAFRTALSRRAATSMHWFGANGFVRDNLG